MLGITAVATACNNDTATDPKRRMLPNSLASATDVDTIAATATLPLYRGQDANGANVYFIITESNNVDESIRLGVNWTPKLVHAMQTKAVQTVTKASGGRSNPNGFPVPKFVGNVDFSPVRKLVPGRDLFPLDPSTVPGSTGDAMYTPLVTFDGKIVYNASHVANKTGLHDRVLSIDSVGMKVKMKLVHGFYEGFSILYSSTETSDHDLAALEQGTFTPNLNFAPFPGDDKPFRSAREALVPIVNGPRGVNNPERQGLQSAVLGEGDPLNLFQEQAGCEDANNPSAFCDAVNYSPLWDVHPVKWTQAAIDAGIVRRITSDKREPIAPLNVIELYADGWLTSATPQGARNSSLGGIPAAGIIVNCPIIFVSGAAR
ncbi:MAG: hypothetical protein H0W63_03620 [Gemmatimonadaceae bacterium]|nr:hypothetical protein [Gemmatimonadaceae bacterium]